MRIAIGSDHRGIEQLRQLPLLLTAHTLCAVHEPEAPGTGGARCDYPDIALAVATAVATGQADRGILICGSGIGMSIAANKVRGIRAALVHDELSAEMSRRHNDANVLCLSASLVGPRGLEQILKTWLNTAFEGGRHERRLQKIAAIEQAQAAQAEDPVDVTNPREANAP